MGRTFSKYRLLERIALGGMAEVWRAELPGAKGFTKQVALKLVRGDRRADRDFVLMFEQEARLALRLDHPNLVHSFEAGEVNGQYYIAMELVRGRTLREVVDRCRGAGVRFGIARAVHVCAAVARALDHAHRMRTAEAPAGVVHRDVSPQNVLLSFEGGVKLADFGVARALGAEQTSPGTVKGKLAYMAPEQARGEPVDARADVFALGALLWELCSGRRLFARETEAATLAALLGADPVTPPSAWNDAVPPELDAAILGALERDPAKRTASAGELASVLRGLELRLPRDAAELDVRALLLRLWPEGDAESSAPPALTLSTTLVRAATTRTLAVAASMAGSRWRALAAAGLVLLVEPSPASAPASPAHALAAPGGERGDGAATSRQGDPRAASAPDRRGAPSPAAEDTSPTATPRGVEEGAARSPVPPAVVPPATLAIWVAPWAEISIDGGPEREAPVTVTLGPGSHRLRARHPTLGRDERVVRLAPGERGVWRVRLSR